MDINYLSSEFNFDGASPAKITYAMNEQAVVSKINVRDETGKTIYSADASKSPGQFEFFWNGSMDGGGLAPPGTYTISVDALNVNEDPIESSVVVSGRVKGVESQNGQIFAVVGDRAVPVSNILSTEQPNNSVNDNSALTAALSYVGLDVTYLNSDLSYDGSPTSLEYTLSADADRAKILVFDSGGNTVFTDDVSRDEGTHTYTWDGRLNDGSFAQPGLYQFVVDALDANDNRIPTSSLATGRVTGLESLGNEILLVTDQHTVPLSNVTRIDQPTQQDNQA